MRRVVCREKLVYLDIVRTFPDTGNSIQQRSSLGDPNCIYGDTQLDLYIE
jgi:hypothetical protein